MLWRALPIPIVILAAGMFIWHLYSTRKKNLQTSDEDRDPLEEVKEENLSVMQKVVEAHRGYTAEVFQCCVRGKRRVETFRLLDPGEEVEIRCDGEVVKVYAFGEYMTDMLVPEDSHLPELFAEGVPIKAYLGGRDLEYVHNDGMDFASLIVFYKVAGIPPTTVNLE